MGPLISGLHRDQAFSWGFFALFVEGSFAHILCPPSQSANTALEVRYGMGEHGAALPQSVIAMQMKVRRQHAHCTLGAHF
jgi:hypothetical protein